MLTYFPSDIENEAYLKFNSCSCRSTVLPVQLASVVHQEALERRDNPAPTVCLEPMVLLDRQATTEAQVGDIGKALTDRFSDPLIIVF